ncbi:MAG: hypothetical protein FWH11_03875 [Micrococcales bacterium]|nr:hypothetical protein [Micrococcales bacterium]
MAVPHFLGTGLSFGFLLDRRHRHQDSDSGEAILAVVGLAPSELDRGYDESRSFLRDPVALRWFDKVLGLPDRDLHELVHRVLLSSCDDAEAFVPKPMVVAIVYFSAQLPRL